MFFFRHPKPVVDRRPVAEHSVQIEAKDLPVLVELKEILKPTLPTGLIEPASVPPRRPPKPR
ncbi:hypothetical protein [Roseateles sp. L2-2]|uniref:hypothetical protein n=1 Tax=Roseateles sp. L2-2 TaxID=3422597 RepID=UPI003D36ECFE